MAEVGRGWGEQQARHEDDLKVVGVSKGGRFGAAPLLVWCRPLSPRSGYLTPALSLIYIECVAVLERGPR